MINSELDRRRHLWIWRWRRAIRTSSSFANRQQTGYSDKYTGLYVCVYVALIRPIVIDRYLLLLPLFDFDNPPAPPPLIHKYVNAALKLTALH